MNLPGGWELVLVVLVIMVLFGAKRLPEASRSLGRSLRIFKAETKGLRDDDKPSLRPVRSTTATCTTAPSPRSRRSRRCRACRRWSPRTGAPTRASPR